MTDDGRYSSQRGDRLRGWLQHLVPQRLVTSLLGRATRVRFGPWKNWQIRWFIRRYGVDMSEALEPEPRAYVDFNTFFTRALRPGCRPRESDGDAILSPADGRISEIGDIRAGRLLQAKGRRYSLDALLGGNAARAAPFQGGRFATVYLSPRDYHRVHMPLAGDLREMIYVPGRMFSVNFATARTVSNLFARNERLICLFDTHIGPMALILVGAMIVAGMETVWSGPVTPPHGESMQSWSYDAGSDGVRLGAGEEMGRFNIGSTVIVLLPVGQMQWRADLEAGSAVRIGEALGRVLSARDSETVESAAEG